jgi:hypothetical protein
MASGWDGLFDMALKAGVQRCAFFELMDGRKVGGAGPDGGITVIRDMSRLIEDVRTGHPSTELHFDGVKFITVSSRIGALAGKAGAQACAVQTTTKMMVIAIGQGTPRSMLEAIAPVAEQLSRIG